MRARYVHMHYTYASEYIHGSPKRVPITTEPNIGTVQPTDDILLSRYRPQQTLPRLLARGDFDAVIMPNQRACTEISA